jgi:hypothetical protein
VLLVYAAESSDVDKELEWLLPKHLRCWNGMVRVYQPGAQVTSEIDARRHRYFTGQEIIDRSPAAVQNLVVTGIVRRGRLFLENTVSDVDDIRAKQREYRFAELKSQVAADGTATSEWTAFVEAENARLGQQIHELKQQIDAFRDVTSRLEDTNRILENDVSALKVQLERVESGKSTSAALGNSSLAAIQAILEKKATLNDLLTVLSQMYAERLVVLNSAFKSARDAHKFEDIERAFELMLTFVTEYWSRLNSGLPNLKAKEVFGAAFSAKESETVENNKHARKLRTFEYNDAPLEMMSHLKLGVKPSVARTWRMHFAWDADTNKLVIGHCGCHLDHA